MVAAFLTSLKFSIFEWSYSLIRKNSKVGKSRRGYRSSLPTINETWSDKEEDLIRLVWNDARMVRWMCTMRPEAKIYNE